MPIIPAELVHANLSIDREEVQRRLLARETLLQDTPDHLLEVVDVLKSYGEVLDAYSINLIYQAERQFLNPVPIFKYLDGDHSPAGVRMDWALIVPYLKPGALVWFHDINSAGLPIGQQGALEVWEKLKGRHVVEYETFAKFGIGMVEIV